MEQAQGVHALHQAVHARLGTIAAYLKSFREREDARERDWQARSDQMNQRIRELEHSARTMEANLRQEHELASTDPLTGLANRLVFERHMARACLERARGGAESCLLVLDIDRFKYINDNFGHAAGDRALRIVAEQLKAVLRPNDMLARYGGEEFVAVLPNTGGEAGREIAEVLRNCIESIGFRGQQRPVRITLSCGLTVLRADDTPESAFERADRALYQAKHGGRNRCEVL
jgi:diguanylate cyclase